MMPNPAGSSSPLAMMSLVKPQRNVHHRYSVLLSLILVTVAFELAAPDTELARLIAVVLQAGTLVAAVITAQARRWVLRLTVVASCLLVAVAVGGVLSAENDLGADSARLIQLLLVALAPPVIVAGLRRHFEAEQLVTRETMSGVLCLYLLIGLFFGTAFGATQAVSGEDYFTRGDGDSSDFLYFSYSTLTTTGYGDFVAATNLGRSLAITEALIGQIYLVTVVAVIVSGLGAARRSRA
jgi:hypothetical protein